MVFLLTNEINLNTGYSNTYLFKVIFAITILILLMVVYYYFKKNFGIKNFNLKSKIKIIESRSIGYNNFLLIVSVENRFYLISQTKDRINLIDTLDDFKIEEEDTTSFSNIFNKYMENLKSNKKNQNSDKGNEFED